MWKSELAALPLALFAALSIACSGAEEPTAESSSETAPDSAVAAEGETITIEVVDGGGQPVVGAEVVVLDRALYDRAAFRDAKKALVGRYDGEVLRRFGRTTTTDGAGRTAHLWSGEATDVYVMRPFDRERKSIKRHEDGVLRIVAEPPQFIVRTVDRGGAPVGGVRVTQPLKGLGQQHWHGLLGALAAEGQPQFDTDGDGYCLPWRPMEIGLDQSGVWTRLEVLADPPLERLVPRDRPDDDVVVFELPPTAPVRVQLVDAEGAPAEGDQHWVALMTELPPPSGHGTPPIVVEEYAEGGLTFAHVAIGLDLIAVVESKATGATSMVELPGPTVAGEPIELVLSVPVGNTVTARLVDAGGEPVANVMFGLRIEAADGETEWARTRTDAGGRWSLGLEAVEGIAEAAWAGARLELFGVEGRDQRRVDFELAGASSTDLGDLELIEEPIVAAGVLIDDAGHPIKGARVDLLVEQVDDTGGDSLAIGGATDWTWAERFSFSDRDGRFALRAEVDPQSRYGVRVAVDQFAFLVIDELRDHEVDDGLLVPVEVGALGLELVLERSGSLVAHFDASRVIDGGLTARLVPSDDPDGFGELGIILEAALWEGLAPGSYELRVESDFVSEPLLVIEDLVVPPNGACEDPRLERIDLSGVVRSLAVIVEGADGRALPQWVLGQRRPEDRFSVIDLDQGDLVHIEPGGSFTGFIAAKGHRPQFVEAVSQDLTVRLEPGIPVEIVAPGIPKDVDPRSIAVELTLTDLADGIDGDLKRVYTDWGMRGGAWLDSGGRVGVGVGLPGTYRVEVSRTLNGASGANVETGDSEWLDRKLEIRDDASAQRFEIELPPELFD